MSNIIQIFNADKLLDLLQAGTNIVLSIVGDKVKIDANQSFVASTYQYAESEAESTTTSTAYKVKTSISAGSLVGNYLIQWSYQAKSTIANAGFDVALNVNGVLINVSNHIQLRSTFPIDYHIYSGMRVMNFNISTTISLQFKSVTSGQTTAIKNARIQLIKLS